MILEKMKMNKKEVFITQKCPKCGKELKVKINTLRVFCLNCKTWSKVVLGEKSPNDKNTIK
jgi:endogenous inhibitor of DNA gyrase (YacG/DUF329 family)